MCDKRSTYTYCKRSLQMRVTYIRYANSCLFIFCSWPFIVDKNIYFCIWATRIMSTIDTHAVVPGESETDNNQWSRNVRNPVLR